MHVREALTDDVEALGKIARDTFSMACPASTPAEELERYIRENLTSLCFHCALTTSGLDVLVLEDAGVVIGFSLVDHRPEMLGLTIADGIPELKRCYVAAKHHGSGAAQRLIAATLGVVSSRIRLTVSDQNSRAIGFYKRNGFRIVGETTFQCGNDVHRDLVMVRG